MTGPVNTTAVDYSYAYVLLPVHSMGVCRLRQYCARAARESRYDYGFAKHIMCAAGGGGVKGGYTRLRLPKGCIAHVGAYPWVVKGVTMCRRQQTVLYMPTEQQWHHYDILRSSKSREFSFRQARGLLAFYFIANQSITCVV